MRLLNVVNRKNFLILLLVSHLMFFSVSQYIPIGTVAADFVHNITVFTVSTNVTVAAPGDGVGMTVEVGNQGDFAETFNVTAYYRNATASYQVANTTVPMYANTSTTLNFAWNTTGAALGSYEITANATTVPGETETSDNARVADEAVVVTATTVLVDPVLNTANPAESFTMDVKVQDVVNLYSYGIKLSFDGAVLEAVNVKEGPFLKAGGSTFFTSSITFDIISVTCALIGMVPGVNGSGTLFNVTFTVQESGESNLTILPTPDSTLVSSMLTSIPFTSIDGKFYTTLPVAKFTYTPHPADQPGYPLIDEAVAFNATESFDPDDPYDPTPGGIVSYEWDFGDGNVTTVTAPTVTHVYDEAEPYDVTLNITDDDGETGEKVQTVTIQFHDIAVINVTVTPTELLVGSELTINVTVLNKGSVGENLNVTVYANMQPVQTKRFDYYIPPATEPRYNLPPGENETTTLTWDTTGMSPGNYTISVKAYLVHQNATTMTWESTPGIEQNLYDNGMVYGDITLTGEEAHDLAITSVNVNPTLLELDEWSYRKATVENKGNADEQYNATITIYLNSAVVDTELWWNETLLAGISTTLEFPRSLKATNTTMEGEYNITVSVILVNATTLDFLEPYNATVPDDNPADNWLSLSEPADIRLLPVAHFTYSPSKPLVDQTVIFNATASYAPGIPGGTIENYKWNFGDGTDEITQTDPIATHTYRAHGRFSVTLTVTDDGGDGSSTTKVLGQYNILITNVTFSPHIATSGESISIDVTVQTRVSEESFNVTTYYNENEILTQTDITQPVGNYTTLTFTWDTTGVPGGNYTVKAVATATNKNMTYIGGAVTIQRLPSTISITASPTTFTIGATTTINGTVSPTQSEVKVTIWYRLSGEQTWSELANVTTSADGTYSYPWTPETAGAYAVKSSWQGSNIIMPDESEVRVIAVQEAPPLSPFLYTTVGLIAAIVILTLYFIRTKKPESK